MELTALITLALLIEYFIFMMLVGAARGKTAYKHLQQQETPSSKPHCGFNKTP